MEWKDVFEACPVPLGVYSADGDLIFLNLAAKAAAGGPLMGLLTSPSSVFGHEEWTAMTSEPSEPLTSPLPKEVAPDYSAVTAAGAVSEGQPFVILALVPRTVVAGDAAPTSDQGAAVEPNLVIKVMEYQQKFADQERLALTDVLTGAMNRRAFEAALQTAMDDSAESGDPFSLVMIDIDRFKSLNDTYGHQEGDRALVGLGKLLRDSVRSIDRVARLGGEEFAVVLPRTDADASIQTAERLRLAVQDATLCAIPITASFGIVTSVGTQISPEDAYRLADTALYRSKETGRNRVTHADRSEGQERSTA